MLSSLSLWKDDSSFWSPSQQLLLRLLRWFFPHPPTPKCWRTSGLREAPCIHPQLISVGAAASNTNYMLEISSLLDISVCVSHGTCNATHPKPSPDSQLVLSTCCALAPASPGPPHLCTWPVFFLLLSYSLRSHPPSLTLAIQSFSPQKMAISWHLCCCHPGPQQRHPAPGCTYEERGAETPKQEANWGSAGLVREGP